MKKDRVEKMVSTDLVTLYHGDCIKVLRKLGRGSVDLIITDPPYGISFMASSWDYDVPSVELWAECKRVLKPHGVVLSFCGTRTYHQLVSRIEQAGFIANGTLGWVYGSGMAKGHNIAAYAQGILEGTGCRTVRRKGIGNTNGRFKTAVTGFVSGSKNRKITDPRAKKFIGWSTALKPAIEPVVIASVEKIDRRHLASVLQTYGPICYSAKAGSVDRHDGLGADRNVHPTVKPTRVMRWLVDIGTSLITNIDTDRSMKKYVVVDPYTGSGSTGRAVIQAGHRFIGMDLQTEFIDIARRRIAAVLKTKATGLWSFTDGSITKTYSSLRANQ